VSEPPHGERLFDYWCTTPQMRRHLEDSLYRAARDRDAALAEAQWWSDQIVGMHEMCGRLQAEVEQWEGVESERDQARAEAERLRAHLDVAAERDRDLCAEVDRYDALTTRLRTLLDAAGVPHVVPYPLPTVGEPDPYTEAQRAGGRARPLDERLRELVDDRDQLRLRCLELMSDREMACEEPCGSCCGCQTAAERQG